MSAIEEAKVLALDIGATKIAIALMNSELTIESRSNQPSQVAGDLWSALEERLQPFTSEAITHIGVAAAGPINLPLGEISPVNIHQWRDFPIVANLQRLFPSTQISLIGDCTALALAEHTIGAGVGINSLLGVVVSTGIGGGLILDGKVHHGQSGNAGLIGHHTISFDSDRICVCGRRGCLEEFARGPKMVESARDNGWNGGDDFQSLVVCAQAGDQVAITAIDNGARALAAGLINVMMILDLHTVVIGGGVSLAGDIYWQPLHRYLAEESLKSGFLKEIQVLPAGLGSDSGLYGAAIHALGPTGSNH